jgi:hypothetical protein
MDTFLGLFGMVIWIVGTIALAAAVTYVVVKLSPGKKKKDKPAPSAESSS